MIRDKTILDLKSNASWRELHARFNKLSAGEYELFICDKKFSRSASQRKYYWAVIVHIISETCGYSKAETNELLKLHYNPIELVDWSGKTTIVGGSIESLPVSRVEEVYAAIRSDFALMDIDLPLPEKVTNEEYITIDQLHQLYRDE